MTCATQRRRDLVQGSVATAILVVAGLALLVPLVSVFPTAQDRAIIDWLRRQSITGPWRALPPGGGYRPLTLALWQAATLLPGQAGVRVVRWFTVALHLGNTILVMALLARRYHRLLLGFSVALLFLVFPPSYGVLWQVSSLALPLGTALVLGSLLLGTTAASTRGRLASLILALLAPLACETGMLVAPLLTLLVVTERRTRTPAEVVRAAGPYWWPSLAGLVLHARVAMVRPAGYTFIELAATGLVGWLHPLATALTKEVTGLGGVWALVASTVVAVAVVIGMGQANHGWKLGLLAFAWFAFWRVPDWALILLGAWCIWLWAEGEGRLVVLALGWTLIWLLPALSARLVESTSALYGACIGGALLCASPLSIRRAPQKLMTALAITAVLSLAVAGYRDLHKRRPLAASFEGVGLLAATCERQGQDLRLVLEWQVWQPVAPDISVFVHLCDGSGRSIAECDGDPLHGQRPFATWKPGDEFAEIRSLALPSHLTRGGYTIQIGLYDRRTGERVPAVGPDGRPYPERAVPVGAVNIF